MVFFNLSLWLGQISICIRLNQWIRRLMHSNLVKLELRIEKCLYQVVRGIKACRSLPAVQISSSEFSVLAYKIVHLVFFSVTHMPFRFCWQEIASANTFSLGPSPVLY